MLSSCCLPLFGLLRAAPLAGLHAEDAVSAVDPATGYRVGNYRSATPAQAPGATTVSTADVQRLREAGAALIDTFGVPGIEPDPLSGEWVFAAPHETIPGSSWVPNVGTGTLTRTMEAYFRESLAHAAGPPPGKSIVFFCQKDCWISWNAAKRAASWGYTAVNWYPEGTDGWMAAGLPFVEAATPRPVAME